MHKKEDIHQLSDIFIKFEKNLKMLIDGFGRSEMESIIEKYGMKSCLIGYHDVVVKETLSLVKSCL